MNNRWSPSGYDRKIARVLPVRSNTENWLIVTRTNNRELDLQVLSVHGLWNKIMKQGMLLRRNDHLETKAGSYVFDTSFSPQENWHRHCTTALYSGPFNNKQSDFETLCLHDEHFLKKFSCPQLSSHNLNGQQSGDNWYTVYSRQTFSFRFFCATYALFILQWATVSRIRHVRARTGSTARTAPVFLRKEWITRSTTAVTTPTKVKTWNVLMAFLRWSLVLTSGFTVFWISKPLTPTDLPLLSTTNCTHYKLRPVASYQSNPWTTTLQSLVWTLCVLSSVWLLQCGSRAELLSSLARLVEGTAPWCSSF